MEDKQVSISYTYDELDRLSSVSYGDGKTVRYSYDEAGNLVSVQTVTGDPPPAESKAIPVEIPSYPASDPVASAGEVPVTWFLNRGGESYGPYSWEEMLSFAAEGRIEPHDLVWNREMTGWAPARDIGGLIK